MKNYFLLFFCLILVLSFIVCPGCTSTKAQEIQPEGSSSYPAETQKPARTTVTDPIESIRAFIGDPAAPVVLERKITNIYGENLEMYRVNKDRFTVDAKTGTVIGALFLSTEPVNSGPYSRERAETVAREYAEKHFPGFTTRTMQLTGSETLDHGAGGIEYSVTWSEQSLGINVGSRVRVSVSPDGKILSYYAQDIPAPVVQPAKISKETANATAVDYVIARTQINNITTIESSPELNVLPSDRKTVAWTVDLEVRFMSPRGIEDHRGGKVDVDAMNGTVLKYEPCM